MARNRRRSDPTGSYIERVEESDAYENIAGMIPGIGTAITISDIEDELNKEEPDYLKIGMLAGTEAIGLIPGLGTAAKNMIRKGADMARQTDEVVDVASNVPKVAKSKFKNTVKAYKLFTKGEDGKLYPLFVDADTEVPVGQYMKAVFPEYRFKAANGNFYVPSRGTAGKKGTGDNIKIPDQETRDMLIEAGFLPKGSKAKTIRAVAARPGWHAGDTPMAKHIGPEVVIDGKTYKIRGEDQIWAEVEMPADIDWQAIADSRAVMKKDGTPNVKTAHITDELPFGGYYRYKTNPNMQGQWLISGDMKVNRVLDRDEVKRLNAEAGFEDLPTEAELRERLGKGFAAGGLVGEDMYQGIDDYQMPELGMGMNEGGAVPDNTVGVDPVSGNEVPIGSLPEEVRDDIPAQLSEGEYVVPADVVRYYGVKFFEDLRAEAKQGWAMMEANGRVGGEPVEATGMEMGQDELPFDISELQVVEMNEGGFLGGYDEGGDVNNFDTPSTSPTGNPFATNTISTKKYVDGQGNVRYVTFSGDTPLSYIPPEFKEEGTQEEAPTTEAAPVQQDTISDVAATANQEYIDRISKFGQFDPTNAAFEDYQAELNKATGMGGTVMSGFAGGIGGPFAAGAVSGLINNAQKKKLEQLQKDADKRAQDAKEKEDVEAMKNFSKLSGEIGDILEGKETKTPFGQTLLGDLIGWGKDNDIGLSEENKGKFSSMLDSFFDSLSTNRFDAMYEPDRFESNADRESTAVSDWQDSIGAIAAARESGDIRAEHEARLAQAAASRAATRAIQERTGWTGFFSPPEPPSNNNEDE